MTGRCGAGVVCPTGAEMYPAACPAHEPNGCERPVPAPSPAAAGLPAEDVERVARALWEASGAAAKRWTWPDVGSILRDHYRTLAAAALAAAALAEMRPTAAEVEARVQAAANQRAAEELRAAADVIDLGPRFLGETTPAQVNRNRAEFITAAALAPVPPDADGGERR